MENTSTEEDIFVPTGDCESVSVVGTALTGGLNPFQRHCGLLCDLVVAYRIVTPAGVPLDVTPESDNALFKALRGAGGSNFGVVLSVTLKVEKVPRARPMVGVDLEWDIEEATAVWQGWGAFAAQCDDRLVLQIDMCRTRLSASGIFLGDETELQGLLDSSTLPAWQHMRCTKHDGTSFWTQFTYNDDVACRWKNFGILLDQAPGPELIEALRVLLNDVPFPALDVNIMCLPGGGMVAQPGSSTSFPWRNHVGALQIIARWRQPHEDQAALGWACRVRALFGLAADSSSEDGDTRFATQHFDPSPLHLYAGWPLAEQSRQDAMERYYGDNVSELRRVKVRVDPENVFRCPQSIDGT